MVIAVDFDQTLADTDATKIYYPNTKLINYLIERREQGDKVILWTCREDKRLEQAVEWCKHQGLEFDAVNDNLTGLKRFGLNSRKIVADQYIDDTAVNKEEFGLPFRG